MTTRIRLARVADAERLSAFAAAAFRETFAAENTPEDIARYVADAFTPQCQAAEIVDPASTVLLAERPTPRGEAELQGYAQLFLGPTPDAVRGAQPIELKRLYVARASQGQGVAQALMDEALDAARVRGAGTVWLGVWERNPRAFAFYRKVGFERVGEHTFVLGSDVQTDWVLARSLVASASN